MTSYTHYLRCDECGVDAGRACRDDDDREALVVCDGRRLHIGDSADRLEHGRREHRPASRRETVDRRPQAVSRRARGVLSDPVHVPCQCCGTPTRLWGAAVVTGETWCALPACREARTRKRNASGNDRRRIREQTTPRAPPKVRQCVICGADVSAHGITARTEAACPGACREARWAQRYAIQLERDRLRRAASPARVLCAWCGTSLPGVGRRPGQSPCCGDGVCVRARATEKRRAAGVHCRRLREAPPMEVIPPVAEGVPCDWCREITPRPRHPRAKRVGCSPDCAREINRSRCSERAKRLPNATDPQQHHAP